MTDKTGWEDMFDINPKVEGYEKHIMSTGIEVKKENSVVKESRPFDRYGNCPHCKAIFDGGDIFEELCKKDALTTQNNTAKIAALYGWTKENKKRFSNVVDHVINGDLYHECPKCLHVFENITGKEYNSLLDLKIGKYNIQPIAEFTDEMNGIEDLPF